MSSAKHGPMFLLSLVLIIIIVAVIVLPIIPMHRSTTVTIPSDDVRVYTISSSELGWLDMPSSFAQGYPTGCVDFQQNMLISPLYLLTGFGFRVNVGEICS